MNAPFAISAGLFVASWIVAVLAYLGMMAGPSPTVVKLHCARLRIRATMLPFACPELFQGRAAIWRRLHMAALGTALGALVAGAALSVVLPR